MLFPNQDRIQLGDATIFGISMDAGSHVSLFLQCGDGFEKNLTHPSMFGSAFILIEKYTYTNIGCYDPIVLVYNKVSVSRSILLVHKFYSVLIISIKIIRK